MFSSINSNNYLYINYLGGMKMSLIKVLRQFRRYKGRIKFYSKDGILMYENTLENTLFSIFYDNFWCTLVIEYNVEYGWIKLDCKKAG
jgi:hypothetical protein